MEMLTRALLVILGVGLAAAVPNREYNNENYLDIRTRSEANQTKIFCYLNGTRITRGSSQFRQANLYIDRCTHLVYGAAFINNNNVVQPISQDLERGSDGITFSYLNQIKAQKNVKTILSIHGNPEQFSTMARQYRSTFSESVSSYIKHYEFDGVNIDWQYPGRRGRDQLDDKQNFNMLIQDLKNKIRVNGKLLTVSLPPTRQGLDDGYDYENDNLLENVDYWFIMGLEYYNHGHMSIGANAPIIGNDGGHSVEDTIKNIKSKDRLRRDSLKLILVIPFYGKLYTLAHELQKGESPIGQSFVNRSPGFDSVLSYHDVCKNMQSAGVDNWYRGVDVYSKSPYAVNNKKVLLFEDPLSIAEKTNLALRNGLGGVMAYSLDLDDYDGTCAMDHMGRTHNNNRPGQGELISAHKYPLLEAMQEAVRQGGSGSSATGPVSLLVAFLAAALLAIHG